MFCIFKTVGKLSHSFASKEEWDFSDTTDEAIHHHLPATVWYPDAEQGSHYRTDADLLFHSQPCDSVPDRWDGMGWDGGGRAVSLGGATDPLPLPISCTNNMPHASWARPILSSDRSSPALKPPRTTGHSPLPAVSNSLERWPAEAWTNSPIAIGTLTVH